MSASMLEYALRPSIMQDLKAHLHGELISPNDQGYEAARKVWNGMIDKYPAAIVRCADVVDVIRAVQFARDHHLEQTPDRCWKRLAGGTGSALEHGLAHLTAHQSRLSGI